VDKSNYLRILGNRLAQERARLGLTQAQVAEFAAIARRTQVNYESGERAPDASYLDRVGQQGIDTLYVLTGRHEQPKGEPRVAEPGSTYKLAGLNPAHVRAAAIAVLTQLFSRHSLVAVEPAEGTASPSPIDTTQISEAIVVIAEMSESVEDFAHNAAHVLRLLP
jgi:transcriptional regulator with XRE-family HTH domain